MAIRRHSCTSHGYEEYGDAMADEKFRFDPSRDPHPGVDDHALPDDADAPHPLADPANDPTPGVPGHAAPAHALPDDASEPHPLADPANDPTPGVPGHAKDDEA
jgi:hypothetical protein